MGGSAVYEDEPSQRTVVGDRVGGFTLVRQLGAGGMGETWEAVRRVGPYFEQRVAVKLGSRELLRHPEGRELLRREASLAASLRHPNIASVLDWDEEQGYIICELVEGADFRAVLREAPSNRLSAPLLVHMIAQIARGLSHAHRRLLHGQPSPVIHRDMSPGNVVVDYDGNLKIVDFGIAKAVGSGEWSQSIKGKLAYMAPEQATGGLMDGRVDQYALGVMAYEAATSVRPNDGVHDGETLAKILDGNHISVGRQVPNLPAGLAEIIERMLSLRPEDRFASMDDVIDALEPLTPPLTIHRSLAVLVHRAHPPHTIVHEGGKFVSRPVVSFELPPRDPLALAAPRMAGHTPSSVRSRSPDLRHVNPFGRTEGVQYPRSSPGSDLMLRVSRSLFDGPRVRRRRWLVVAVGCGMALVAGVVGWAVFPSASESPKDPVFVPATAGSPSPSSAAFAPPNSPGALAAPARLAGPPPAQPAPAAPKSEASASTEPIRSSSPAPTREAKEKRAREPKERSNAARSGSLPSTAEVGRAAAGESASVRVKVFPWGRVWIDGKLRGSAPPILSAKVRAGTHTIAVGHESPMDSRIVSVGSGDSELVSFDLEGW